MACPSISGQLNPERFPDGRDEGAVDGAATLPYQIPNVEVKYSMVNTPVPTCWLRSVYNTQNGLANECFLDEIARAGNQDPVKLRLDLLLPYLGVFVLQAFPQMLLRAWYRKTSSWVNREQALHSQAAAQVPPRSGLGCTQKDSGYSTRRPHT